MQYSPGSSPQFGFDIQAIWNELYRLRDALQTNQLEFIELTVHYNEPDKPKEGRVYYADGTSWNPGNGKGLYLYVDGWVPIATTINTHRPGKALLTFTTYAPLVKRDTVEPIPGNVIYLTGFAPDVHLKANKIGSIALTITGIAPTVTVTP